MEFKLKQPSRSTHDSNVHGLILTLPLTVYSFYFVVPYRIHWDEAENSYKTSSSVLRKVCWKILIVNKITVHKVECLCQISIGNLWSHSYSQNFANTSRKNSYTPGFYSWKWWHRIWKKNSVIHIFGIASTTWYTLDCHMAHVEMQTTFLSIGKWAKKSQLPTTELN